MPLTGLVQPCNNISSYVTIMIQRFTLVRTQSVQSGLFHSRRQKANERIVQDLSRLHQKAYPQANQGSQETKTMGKAVLVWKD